MFVCLSVCRLSVSARRNQWRKFTIDNGVNFFHIIAVIVCPFARALHSRALHSRATHGLEPCAFFFFFFFFLDREGVFVSSRVGFFFPSVYTCRCPLLDWSVLLGV